MMFVREADNITFLWNGEHPLKLTPESDVMWHDKFGEMKDGETQLLDSIMDSKARAFTILGRGRYRVLERGTFPE